MIDSTLPIEALQSEIVALRQQLAALERARQAAEQRAQLYQAVVEQLPISVSVWHLEQPDDPRSFRLVNANPLNLQTAGFDVGAQAGRRLVEIFPGVPEMIPQLYAEVAHTGQPRDLGTITAADDDEQLGGVTMTIQVFPLPHNHICVVVENITERKRAEEMLRQSITQEETIRAQEAALAELSTPLIPISDQVMVMPLIGAVDSRRAQQVLEALLEGVASSRALVAILDITGVPVVDTQVANALLRAAQAVKLLGAQIVLTGIRPEVAQTLVGLGADLNGIVTCGSLQTGIAYATSRN
jgi:anti-anti-sigma regulatory factor